MESEDINVQHYLEGVVPFGEITNADVMQVLRNRGPLTLWDTNDKTLRATGHRISAVFSGGYEAVCVGYDDKPAFFSVITPTDVFLLGDLLEVVRHLDRRGI